MNNMKNLIPKKWSGGITREIFRDKFDFDIRISCAEIYPGENVFSDFTGYKRILKILESNVIIKKNNDRDLFLNPDNIFIFDGSDTVKSINEDLVLDFNVIYKPEFLQVSFEEIKGVYNLYNFDDQGTILIFSLENDNNLFLNDYNSKLEKYDFLILDSPVEFKLEGKFILIKFQKKN